jgi:glycosyltransferase involved in cell wall biosynthesis
MLRVAILVPIYNVEQYIERCARSLFEQTYNDIEYVFVDDCSPDKSIELLEAIIEEYPKRKEHVRIIKHEKNRGLAAARNTAVENCRTDFLMHVDSDDWLEKDAIEKLVGCQERTDADIITGQSIQHHSKFLSLMERPHYYEKFGYLQDLIKPTIHHTIWGRLIRTSLYKDHGIKTKENVNIGEDLQVIPQLFYYAENTSCITDTIYHYDCTNEGSYMNQFSGSDIKRLTQDTISMEIIREFFLERNVKCCDQAERALLNYYLKLLDFYCKFNDKSNYHKVREKLFSLKKYNRSMSRQRIFKLYHYNLYRLSCYFTIHR